MYEIKKSMLKVLIILTLLIDLNVVVNDPVSGEGIIAKAQEKNLAGSSIKKELPITASTGDRREYLVKVFENDVEVVLVSEKDSKEKDVIIKVVVG